MPLADICPDYRIGESDRLEAVYFFRKGKQGLDWRVLSEKFTINLTGDPDKDQEAVDKKLAGAVAAIQKKVDIAIEQFEGEITMLPWADKIYRLGYGDYDNYNGGFGSMNDPRTGNLFCLRIHSQKSDESQASNVMAKIEAVVELSFHFALVQLSDKKVPAWSKT